MSSLDDSLKKITILEVLIIIIALIGIFLLLNLFGFSITKDWVYVGIIFYFIYRLRFFADDFRHDLRNIFSKISPKSLLIIVLVNVFFSYGMLYFSHFLLSVPGFKETIFAPLFSLAGIAGVFSTVIISPISEELLFRGIFFNRVKILVPTSFAILISSILFGALHSYGSVISAFVFGVCMCIIYLKTQNILTCIFAHFLNNLIAEFLVHIDTGNLIFTNIFVIALFSILAIVSLYLLAISIHNEWKYIDKK